MKRFTLLLSLSAILAGAAGVAGVAGASAVAKACKPGVHKFDGSTNARTFCGPARATAFLPGQQFTFRRGNCVIAKQYVTLNLGTVVLGSTRKPRPDYFGLTVGHTFAGGTPASKDGTYTGAVLTFVHAHKGYVIGHATVTLTHNRTRGTFTGQVFGNNDPVTGSFRCK